MYSFEFFPPKDVAGEDRLWQALSSLATLHPDFVAVTYGAGGGTRDRTIRITSEITARTNIPTVAHLTCVGSTRDELIDILHRYTESGIKSILAILVKILMFFYVKNLLELLLQQHNSSLK
jgi:methylenetetrahydrofolate reductase (NADPH)